MVLLVRKAVVIVAVLIPVEVAALVALPRIAVVVFITITSGSQNHFLPRLCDGITRIMS